MNLHPLLIALILAVITYFLATMIPIPLLLAIIVFFVFAFQPHDYPWR